jgi:hypothetical protein
MTRRARKKAAGDVDSPVQRLREMVMGFRSTQLLYVAARLQLADHLAAGPQTPEWLAPRVAADPASLRRVLRALASLGLFTENVDGQFATTCLGVLLRRDVPDSLYPVALLYGAPWLWDVYGRMLHSVQTGRSAFTKVHGEPFYDFLEHETQAASEFNDAMDGYSRLEAAAIAAAYDFSDDIKVIDIGGGTGMLLATLLARHRRLTGVVFDRPRVVAAAERQFEEMGVADRAAWAGGDFFAAVPGGGDLYLLKSVLHNWDDDSALDLLRCCRRAMAEGARLLIAERLMPEGTGPSQARMFDVNMLVVPGGRERTVLEYRQLLERAGFAGLRVIDTDCPLSLIEAKAVIRRDRESGRSDQL